MAKKSKKKSIKKNTRKKASQVSESKSSKKTKGTSVAFLITVSAELPVFNFEDKRTRKPEHLEILDGFIENDSLLNYADETIALTGGFLYCKFDESAKKLWIITEYAAMEKPDKKILGEIVDDTCGQWSDGIGEGCFDRFHELSGFSVKTSLKAKVEVREGVLTTPDNFGAADLEERWKKAKLSNRPKGKKADQIKLMNALANRKFDEAETLFEKGVDLNGIIKNKDDYMMDSESPLTFFADSGNTKALAWLLDHGADITSANEDDYQAVHVAKNVKVLQLLLDAGADVNTKAKHVYNRWPLQHRKNLLDAASVGLLIERGADVNCKDNFDKTALMYAAYYRADDAVALLIEHGAEINVQTSSSQDTALSLAISDRDAMDSRKKEQKRIIEMLVKAGAEVDLKILNDAAAECEMDAMKILFKALKIDQDSRRKLLEVLASSRDPQIIDLALENGAVPAESHDVIGKSLIWNHDKVVRKLIEVGCPVKAEDVLYAEERELKVRKVLREACSEPIEETNIKVNKKSAKKSTKKSAKKSTKKVAKKAAPKASKKVAESSSGDKRTFEYRDEKSAKFWEIEVSGSSHTATYGRIGSAGSTTTKDFDTPEAAQTAADKLIQQKMKKGYEEIS